jgi:hypothetical protein
MLHVGNDEVAQLIKLFGDIVPEELMARVGSVNTEPKRLPEGVMSSGALVGNARSHNSVPAGILATLWQVYAIAFLAFTQNDLLKVMIEF